MALTDWMKQKVMYEPAPPTGGIKANPTYPGPVEGKAPQYVIHTISNGLLVQFDYHELVYCAGPQELADLLIARAAREKIGVKPAPSPVAPGYLAGVANPTVQGQELLRYLQHNS